MFKSLLPIDTPYLRNDDTLGGCVFLSFISLIVYYRISKILKEKKINSKMSAKDGLLQLSKIYVVEAGDKTIIGEIPKKVR